MTNDKLFTHYWSRHAPLAALAAGPPAPGVARSKNDGYTLLYSGANMFAIAPHLQSKMPIQRSDFQTISLVSALPMGLVLNAATIPARNLPEFIAYVKANPGKVNYGTSGQGGAQHLLCDLVKDKTGIDMQHVGYEGTSQALQDLIAGRVSAACDGLLAYIPPHPSTFRSARLPIEGDQ